MNVQIIDLISAAIPEIETESKRLDDVAGIDRTLGDNFFHPASIKRRYTPNIVDGQLRTDLQQFEYEDLIDALTVYYLGRDQDGSTFVEKRQQIRQAHSDKSVAITILMEKLPNFLRCVQRVPEAARQ